MARRIFVWGASGHGKVVADAALAGGLEVLGFADDAEDARGREVLGFPVVAVGREEFRSLLRDTPADVVVAIGDNAARKRVFEALGDLGLVPATVIHPGAIVATSARLGAGSVVLANAVVNAGAFVGRNVIVNTGAVVEHDNVLEDHSHVSSGVRLGGAVGVGEGTLVGVGASVRNNVRIGCWSIVGTGSAVVRDLPDGIVAYGSPARVMREVQEGRA